MSRKHSYVTVTDQFCGAGGSSLGAALAGAEIKLAMNHWRLAVETHNTNFPDTMHDCVDISLCDPRRYESTDILITSPECTNHSLAKGARRKNQAQLTMFDSRPPDPSEERSRATMWDVPRFAEHHDYRAVIVENVVDARRWRLWDAWLHAMSLLGYKHEVVYANSMFHWPTPQSRDRMYVVFWKGIPKPELDWRPRAYCPRCEKNVAAVQSWKNPARHWGRYGARNQYVYCCPECAEEAHPYYYPAATAIDWSIPGERIGDRARPLRERTMERIRYGLEKFGKQTMTVQLDYTHSSSNRAWPVTKALPTQTSRQVMALITPFLMQYYTRGDKPGLHGIVNEALPTLSTQGREALIQPPFLTSTNYFSDKPRGVDEEMPTQTTGEKIGIAVPPFTVELYRTSKVHKIDEPLSTMTAGGIHQGLIVPFLTSYYGTKNASLVTDPTATVTTVDRQALVEAPSVEVEDCFFRMLKPHEIGRAMAFPDDYIVLGSSRDKVRQYGNAVTPPVMSWIIQQVMRVLR